MTISREVRSRWYNALSSEASQTLKELLADHPGLLEEGWGDEASQFEWKKLPWKVRTALHVGVKRGNAELVEQVLVLCKVDIPKHSTTEERDGGNPPSTNRKRLSDLAEIEQAQKNDNKIAGPPLEDTMGEGDRQPAKSTRSAVTRIGKRLQKQTLPANNAKPAQKTGSTSGGVLLRKAVSSISRSKHDGEDKSRETARLAIAKWKRLVDDRRSVREQPKDQDDSLLRRLLMAKDGKSNLDAIAIAALHGNRKIFLLLLYAMRECKLHYGKTFFLPGLEVTEGTEQDRGYRANLREATKQVVQSFEPASLCASCVESYKKRLEFNFLPWEEYLFHFLFTLSRSDAESHKEFARALWIAVRSRADSTWRFLLELQDGQGRTPFNVAASAKFKFFEEVVVNNYGEMDEDVVECVLAARDGAGRTALHRALATGDSSLISNLLCWFAFPCVERTNKVVAPLVRERWQQQLPNIIQGWTATKKTFSILKDVSIANGFNHSRVGIESSPLHSAILHRRGRSVWSATQSYITAGRTREKAAQGRSKLEFSSRQPSTICQFFHKFAGVWWNATKACWSSQEHRQREEAGAIRELGLPLREQLKLWEWWGLAVLFPWRVDGTLEVELDAVELAALVGDASDTKGLPLGAYNSISKLDSPRTEVKQPWPALHIAANTGNYEMVKVFLDSPGCDPYIEDWNGNTALHHALNVVTIGKFGPHLLDYVDCKHLQSNDPREGKNDEIVADDGKKKTKTVGDEDPLVDRQGCINLLLEAGCDIFKTNRDGQPPCPQGELSKNSTFRSWWYHRQAKEFDTIQKTLSYAANAISVTAALVATASYVGPLQPPMGFAGNPSQIQDAHFG